MRNFIHLFRTGLCVLLLLLLSASAWEDGLSDKQRVFQSKRKLPKAEKRSNPVFISTFLGGAHQDGGHMGTQVILDNEGGIIVSGYTLSADFPTTAGAVKEEKENFSSDIFISRQDGELKELIASSFLGGSGSEGSWPGTSLIACEDGDIYVAGNTISLDFPVTPSAYDTTANGREDVFIARLDKDFTTIKAATLLGGSGQDTCWAIVRDGTGHIFVAGQTNSSDFPTSARAYDRTFNGGEDIFVAKFAGDLETLLAATLLGADSNEWVDVMTAGADGAVYLGGYTNSPNFPTTPQAYDGSYNYGYYDACLFKFDNDLETLLASTFVGGSGMDFIYAIALDSLNGDAIYVAGHTSSINFPTTAGAYDTSYNGDNSGESDDAFIAWFDTALSRLQAATYLGGSGWENVGSMDFDLNGDVFVAGNTHSPDFPTSLGAYDKTFHGGTLYLGDVFISKLDPGLKNLLASTYVGGSDNDNLGTIAVAPDGYVFAAGGTSSVDFPVTSGAYDTDYNGGWDEWGADAFVIKINNHLAAKWPDIDLKINLVKCKPKKPKLGKKITLICKIKNLGEVKSFPASVKFYLSPKRKLSKNSILIGDTPLAAISPGKVKTLRLRDELSVDIPPGSYYLIASVDEEDLNHDSKKANNQAAAKKKIDLQ